MPPAIRIFLGRDEGAVTVDWVVLTAGIIGMCLLVTIPAYLASGGAATQLADRLVDTVASAAEK